MKSLNYLEFIELYNIHEIGNLKHYYHMPSNFKTALHVPLPIVIKFREDEDYNKRQNEFGEFNLETGFMDSACNFYQCPILLFFVEVKKIQIHCDGYSNKRLSVILNVYSKDYLTFKQIKIFYESPVRLLNVSSIIVSIINVFNLYIDSDKSVKDLKTDIHWQYHSWVIRNRIILQTLAKLEFDFIEVCFNYPRKDTQFYREATITNLPTNSYFINLILEYLKKLHDFKVTYDKKTIIVEYNRHSTISVSYTRKIEFDQKFYNDLMDNLKVEIAANFNLMECVFGMMVSDANDSESISLS